MARTQREKYLAWGVASAMFIGACVFTQTSHAQGKSTGALEARDFRPFTLGQKITLSGAYIFNSAAADSVVVGHTIPASKALENSELASELWSAAKEGRVYMAINGNSKSSSTVAIRAVPHGLDIKRAAASGGTYIVAVPESGEAADVKGYSTGKVISWRDGSSKGVAARGAPKASDGERWSK